MQESSPSPLVPSLAPNESLDSYIARSFLFTAQPSMLRHRCFWTGKQYSLPDRLELGISTLPINLRHLGADFERGFLEEHCLSALGLPFCDGDMVDKKVQTMYSSADPAGWRSLGMKWTKIYETPRFCPACAVEDLETLGYTYWRRTPQVVGVRCCPIHCVRTVATCAQCNARLDHKRLPTIRCTKCNSEIEQVPIDEHDDAALLELRFADAVDGIYAGRITGPMTSVTVGMRMAMLFSQRPHDPCKDLFEYVSDTVKADFLAEIGLPLYPNDRFPWPFGTWDPDLFLREALFQVFTYALLSRDKRREGMFKAGFPQRPQWESAPHPEDVRHRIHTRWFWLRDM